LAFTAALIPPTAAIADAGSYLAARQAVFDRSFSEQAKYAAQTLVRDPQNVELLETLIGAKISIGQFDSVYDYALELSAIEPSDQIAAMALVSHDVKTGNWQDLITRLEDEEGISPLFDGLARAWAEVGLGNMNKALALFEEAGQLTDGLGILATYNRAMAFAMVGDFEAAVELLAVPNLMISQSAVLARVQILSQLERNEEASALLDAMFGVSTDPHVAGLRDALQRGETLDFDVVQSAQEGVAGVFNSVAKIVDGTLGDGVTLLYARLALELDETQADYALFVAEILERFEHFDLAHEALQSVPEQSLSHYVSELARARALLEDDQPEAQIEVLTALTKAYPDVPDVFSAMGDALRREGRFMDAAKAYTSALELTPEGSREVSPLLYARGTTYERAGLWADAEVDLRAALELVPGHPRILNYLGYALLEQGTKLEEAMDMIRAAVEARPEDGYITDSLAWGLYLLGDYDGAIEPMEKAVKLMPVDPIVNDHLGDIYWAVGRKREAEFQWQRALSFDPVEEEGERIRKKLQVGLDEVLTEEGSDEAQGHQHD
jgi:tetratricopeptide (TPR) repeat protein